MTNAFNYARAVAITLLNLEPNKTPAVIRNLVERAIKYTREAGHSDVDVDSLVAQLMHESNVFVPPGTLMEDPDNHIEWLSTCRGGITWGFWTRYRTFLEQTKNIPGPVLSSLDKLTDQILGKLEHPIRNPPWDRRGMVVGSVQSGKTANYCGLICKALDAGYSLIVVLAGLHNNLRSQTQYRIDEGVIGRDSQKDRNLDQGNSLLGVGKIFGNQLHIHSLTNSRDDGDFQKPKAEMNIAIGSDPIVLVIKKNVSVLQNLWEWVMHVKGEIIPGKDSKIIRGVPLLVIDDEADNASINTKDKKGKSTNELDVTAINGSIRKLIDAFEKSAYIGYTATPFANIFINPEAETTKHGKDLFPRSFILNVSPPSNYISPERIFGHDGDVDSGIDPKQGLPLVRFVEDHLTTFPLKHKKDLAIQVIPHSLKRSIYCFVLVCAARRARGEPMAHNSMLVHVSRFVDIQHKVAQLIQETVQKIRRKLIYGEGNLPKPILSELEEIWVTDFEPTTAFIREDSPNEFLVHVTWQEVLAEIKESISRIEVREINQTAKDALDYVNHPQGFNVITIGGDKLSRGLTLEGLSVSYFLRTTQMSDTLMQMGRWFGYRQGYLDLCRLFTTKDLCSWYRHIAFVETELRREFDRMEAAGMTPRRFGLRVREHPGTLLITAMNKMSHSATQLLSYAGQLIQTSSFDTSLNNINKNLHVIETFLLKIGGKYTAKRTINNNAILWQNVPATTLVNHLLKGFSISSTVYKFQKPEMIEFILSQTKTGELTNWTIALVDTNGQGGSFTLGGCTVGKAERAPDKGSWESEMIPSIFKSRNNNIQSPSHQALDLAELLLDQTLLDSLLAKRIDEYGSPLFIPEEADLLQQCFAQGTTLQEAAKRLTNLRNPDAKQINGLVVRQLRPSSHGLLLIYPLIPKVEAWPENNPPFIGLVLSFPSSHTARAVEYKVNSVWEDLFHDADYENDD